MAELSFRTVFLGIVAVFASLRRYYAARGRILNVGTVKGAVKWEGSMSVAHHAFGKDWSLSVPLGYLRRSSTYQKSGKPSK